MSSGSVSNNPNLVDEKKVEKSRIRLLIDGEVQSSDKFVNYLIEQEREIEKNYQLNLGRLEQYKQHIDQVQATLYALKGQMQKTMLDIQHWDSESLLPVTR